MRHVQQTLRLDVAARVVPEHHQAIFHVVIHGEQLTMVGIHRHAGNEPDARFRSHDLAARRRRFFLLRSRSARPAVQQQALPVGIAHQHEIVRRIDRDAVEAGVRIDHHAERRHIAGEIGGGRDRDLGLCTRLALAAIRHQAHRVGGSGGLRFRHERLLDRRSPLRIRGDDPQSNDDQRGGEPASPHIDDQRRPPRTRLIGHTIARECASRLCSCQAFFARPTLNSQLSSLKIREGSVQGHR